MDCVPGTVSAGPEGASITVSWTIVPWRDAETVADCVTGSVVVFARNVVTACPALVEIKEGGTRCALSLVMVSGTEPTVLAEFKVTRHVTGEPATVVLGEHASDSGLSPTSVTVVCADELPRVALMVAFSSKSTTGLVAVNDATLPPAPTSTVGGMASCELVDASWTVAPPAAAAGSVTVQLSDPPPVSVEGLQEIPLNPLPLPEASSVRTSDPPPDALTVTVVLAETAVA